MSSPFKTAALHTLGCKVNFTETSMIAKQFQEDGLSLVSIDQFADIYVVNTCSVTENANIKCNRLVKKLKRINPNSFIVITGCYAQLKSDELSKNNDVILLATGATQPRDLPIPSREANGIYFAMDFLRANTKSLLDSNHEDQNYINAKNKDVIVIGGGDTGTDCIGTALRHGCKSLTNFEILPQPPVERAEDNPWPLFPKTYKVDYGHEESKELFGSDPREFSISGKEFVKDSEGNLTGIVTVEVDSSFKEVSGTEKEWKADLILLAMGFLGPEDYVIKNLKVDLDERSNYKAEHNIHVTSNPKVFAAGDCRRGQSLVVWAINEGRAAAREINNFLS